MVILVICVEVFIILEFFIIFNKLKNGGLRSFNKVIGIFDGLYFIGIFIYLFFIVVILLI